MRSKGRFIMEEVVTGFMEIMRSPPENIMKREM